MNSARPLFELSQWQLALRFRIQDAIAAGATNARPYLWIIAVLLEALGAYVAYQPPLFEAHASEWTSRALASSWNVSDWLKVRSVVIPHASSDFVRCGRDSDRSI